MVVAVPKLGAVRVDGRVSHACIGMVSKKLGREVEFTAPVLLNRDSYEFAYSPSFEKYIHVTHNHMYRKPSARYVKFIFVTSTTSPLVSIPFLSIPIPNPQYPLDAPH